MGFFLGYLLFIDFFSTSRIDDTTRKHESDYRIFCKMILAYGSMFGFLILGMNFPTFLEVTPEIRPYDVSPLKNFTIQMEYV